MFARGLGFITYEDLKDMFELPEDSEIIDVKMGNAGVEFNIISKEEIKGKTYLVPRGYGVRRFRNK